MITKQKVIQKKDNIMEQIPSFNSLIQQSIIDNWDKDALTDFKGATLQYHDVIVQIGL